MSLPAFILYLVLFISNLYTVYHTSSYMSSSILHLHSLGISYIDFSYLRNI